MTLFSQSFGQASPDSPSLVLVHGLFGNADNLAVIRRHFENDMHVLSVDLPNHGRSPRAEHFSFEESATMLIDTIQSAGIENCVLLGHSLGGKVSMLAAYMASELITELVILDIAPCAYEPRHQAVFNGLNNVQLGTIKGRKDAAEQLSEYVKDPGTQAFLLKSLYQDDNAQWQWRFNLSILQQDYDKIIDWPYSGLMFDGPTTFIVGKLSDYVGAEHQENIMQQFPQAKAKIIEAGHWLHAEKPQLINTLLTRILRGTKN